MTQLDQNYTNNIEALKSVDIVLATKIIQSSVGESFELSTVNADHNLYNILDHMHERALYNNIVDDLQDQIKSLQSDIEKHFLYFFGIGNAYILPILLKNNVHKRIAIFEVELELLFVALHIYDFSDALSTGRLKLFHHKSFNFAQAVLLFKEHQALHHAKDFVLHTTARYYSDNFHPQIEDLQSLLVDALSFELHQAKDFNTQLEILHYHMQNRDLQLKSTTLSSLIQQRSKGLYSCIIHDKPSTQELEHLQNLQPQLTLICCESFLPDLLAASIVPQIVVAFDYNDSVWKTVAKDIQEQILLILPDNRLHTALSNNHSKKLIIHHAIDSYRPLPDFGRFLEPVDLRSFALDMSYTLGFSHTVILDTNLHNDTSFAFQNLSYRCSLYKENMQTSIIRAKKIHKLEAKTMTLDRLQELLDKHQMPAANLQPQNLNESDYTTILARYKLKSNLLLQMSYHFQDYLSQALNDMHAWYRALESLENDELLYYYTDQQVSDQLDKIVHVRDHIAKDSAYQNFFYDFLQPCMLLMDLEMAAIQTATSQEEQESREKAMQWTIINYQWINQLNHSVYETISYLQSLQED